jgi:peptidoglycan/LPS O-acetylase OafA/YrhL
MSNPPYEERDSNSRPTGAASRWTIIAISILIGNKALETADHEGRMDTRADVSGHSTYSFNENLQYLRAIAALAVMLFHAAHYVHGYLGPGLYDVFHHFLGLYGVAIFFALSGYLMAILAGKQSAHHFLASRIARIYPAMWIATAVAAIVDPKRILPNLDAAALSRPFTKESFGMWFIVNAQRQGLI